MLPPLAPAESFVRPERRRYQRHALSCECWLEGDDLTIFGPTIDVGIGGLFLRTAIPVAGGALMDVTLKVAGERVPLAARAVVTRIVPARTGLRHGVGIEFLEICEGRSALTSLLQHSKPLPWA
jgi:hypothetical protein